MEIVPATGSSAQHDAIEERWMGPSEDCSKQPRPECTHPAIPRAVRPGIGVLLPGMVQWGWNQRERGLVFLVSFVASLAATVLCWGNPLGWVFLGFAFLTQSAALGDVIRQRSFPVFHSSIALAAISLSIGLTMYVPAGRFLWLYAFPARSADAPGACYLINCRAYQEDQPVPGEWIWMRDRSRVNGLAGQVIAVAGQEVEWTGRRWRVDGKDLRVVHPGSLPFYPASLRFQVPRDHVLIDQEPDAAQSKTRPLTSLALVGRNQIVGRAWARYYPFWDRCLL